MSPLAPLWALGAGDLIGIVLVILFIVIPAIAQVLSKIGKVQQPGGGARPGQPPQARPPARRPAGGGVEDEIGEFLRRVAQRLGGQVAAEPHPPPAAEPPIRAEAVAQQPVEAEIVREGPLGDRVRQQVKEHLNTGKFDRRASQLGDEVAQADEQLEDRLHKKFDHEVSRLAGRLGESATVPGVQEAGEVEDRLSEIPLTAAAGLAAMLGTAETARQAILINEILGRPEDRWV